MPDTSWRSYRVEFRGILKPCSPLRIGSGQQDDWKTDAPILRWHDESAYIPATSLRGVLRHLLGSELSLQGCQPADLDFLFGAAPGKQGPRNNQNAEDAWLGRLALEDVRPVVEPADASKPADASEIRDYVKIDARHGSAQEAAKFDAEVALVENVAFAFRAAYDGDDSEDAALRLFEEALVRLASGQVRVGARAGCGFGRVELSGIEYRAFDRSKPEGLAAWLQSRLEPGGSRGWLPWVARKGTDPNARDSANAFHSMECTLKLLFDGPMLVRAAIPPPPVKVAVECSNPNDYARIGEQVADLTPVRRADNSEYYLPGSSIRGVLRAHANRIAKALHRADAFDTLFGLEIRPYDKRKSKGRIEVSDAHCTNARTIYLDHVAIDRITNAASDGAKFSASALESPCFETTIRVQFKSGAVEETAFALWGLLLRDLMQHGGHLAMGSGTTRGYGFLHHTEVTGATLGLQAGWAAGLEIENAQRTERSGRIFFTLGEVREFGALRPLWNKVEPAWRGGAV